MREALSPENSLNYLVINTRQKNSDRMTNPHQNDPNLPPDSKANPDRLGYGDGYVDGQASEQNYQYAREEISYEREKSSANKGLILGISIASIIGLGLGAYFLSAGNRKPTTVIIPPPAPNSTNSPTQERTIIERTTERAPQVVPVQPSSNTTIIVPANPSSSNQPQNSRTEKTTIERTTERTKEVVPASPPPTQAPDPNLTQPTPQPSSSNPPDNPNVNNPQAVPQPTTGDNSTTEPPANTSTPNGSETSPPPSP
ncbi:hypothetical protein [Merismopedia glauca]